MKKFFLLFYIISFLHVVSYGQHLISAGVTTQGYHYFKNPNNNTSFAFHFPNGFNYKNIGYSLCIGSTFYLFDLQYIKYTSLVQIGDSISDLRDAYSGSFSFLSGITFFPGKRVQIPFYLGIGINAYIYKGGYRLFFPIVGKLRLVVYLSNNVALYTSVAGNVGYRFRSKLLHASVFPEAGLLVSFK